MQIMNVDASFGVVTHDVFIWANYPIEVYLDELSNTKNLWSLGMHFNNV